MKKMSEESTEMLMLLKALVEKINRLESAVFNDDNLLMKSGYVVATTPTPIISASNDGDVDNIAKMEWSEINDLVSKIEGGY
jgi:hypothetical protein|tara:strand:- start:1184 stop:1429 length:246 start_codon:yes stop_codon:yes gene_type:complete